MSKGNFQKLIRILAFRYKMNTCQRFELILCTNYNEVNKCWNEFAKFVLCIEKQSILFQWGISNLRSYRQELFPLLSVCYYVNLYLSKVVKEPSQSHLHMELNNSGAFSLSLKEYSVVFCSFQNLKFFSTVIKTITAALALLGKAEWRTYLLKVHRNHTSFFYFNF